MTTEPDLWQDKPTVVFMTPDANVDIYVGLMALLTMNVQKELGWEPRSIQLIGLISKSTELGTQGLYLLGETGVKPSNLKLLVLWGNTAACARFDEDVADDCGTGTVIMPESGVILPAMRLPGVEADWWYENIHQEYAIFSYASLMRDGVVEEDAPHVFIANANVWN
jgi:hypothetical protein